MSDDLNALRAELMEVQNSPQSIFTEQNVIDLHALLSSKFQIELIPTLDGNKFHTLESLSNTINSIIIKHHGICNLQEIESEASISSKIVQDHICKHLKSVQIVRDSIIGSSFLDYLKEYITIALTNNPCIHISQIANTFNVPTDYLYSIIPSLNLPATFVDSMLFTSLYIDMAKKYFEGSLIGSLRAIYLPTLCEKFKFGDIKSYEIIDLLIIEKGIKGKRAGHYYTPNALLAIQENYCKTEFDNNNYIDLRNVKKLDIAKPTTAIKEFGINGYELHNYVISEELLNKIELNITNQEKRGLLIEANDVSDTLNLDSVDLSKLHKIIEKNHKLILFESTFIPTGFIDKLYDSCKPLVNIYLEKNMNKEKTKKKAEMAAHLPKDEIINMLKTVTETSKLKSVLKQELSDLLFERLDKLYVENQAIVISSSAIVPTSILAAKDIESRIANLFEQLQYIQKSITILKELKIEDKIIQSINAFEVKKYTTPFVSNMLYLLALQNNIPSKIPESMSHEDKLALIKKFDTDRQTFYSDLLKEKDILKLYSLLMENKDLSPCRLKPIDKKGERSSYHKLKMKIIEQLQTELEPKLLAMLVYQVGLTESKIVCYLPNEPWVFECVHSIYASIAKKPIKIDDIDALMNAVNEEKKLADNKEKTEEETKRLSEIPALLSEYIAKIKGAFSKTAKSE